MPTSQAAAIAEAIKSSLKSDLLRTASLSREYCDGIWAIDEQIRRKLLNILEQYEIERKRDVSAVCAEVLEIDKELLTDTDIEINVNQLIQLVKYNVNAKEFDSSLEFQYRRVIANFLNSSCYHPLIPSGILLRVVIIYHKVCVKFSLV